ncbi:MAG: hypothetical protein CFE21_04300 [Bacteroidetes bacterium B1(2017)]|nr:MAG: hypothetical protein CFE21_04300 [Bacteroidetes bacterium B1(2017)]
MFVSLLSISSCKLYKAVPVRASAGGLQEIYNEESYLILHKDSSAWHINEASVSENQKEISGLLEPVSSRHLAYVIKSTRKNHLYFAAMFDPINEVHLYADSTYTPKETKSTIAFSQLNKMELNKKNKGLGIVLSVGLFYGIVLGFVALATATL